jgi:hypothetical protein
MTSRFSYSSLIETKRTKFFTGAQVALRKNKFRGYWLDKSIHFYRMWFHFARLVIDCEHNKIRFGAKNQHSVKLNKRIYKDWGVENYLDAEFDDWFADKIHLFGEEEVSLVKSGEESSEHLYLKFNRYQRKEDILRQARLILNDGKFVSSSRFQIKKQYKYFYLHQQYNVFILRQDGAKNAEVRDWLIKHYAVYSGRVSTEDTSLRRLYRAGERVVLDVAAGEF